MTINTIQDCFGTILHGEKEESRQAARKLKKYSIQMALFAMQLCE